MSPVELIALSLGLSVAVAAVAGLAAVGLERFTNDPTLRDRAWAWALYLPVLPPLAVAATLLAPASVQAIPILPTAIQIAPVVEAGPVAAAPAASGFTLDMGQLATGALILAALLLTFRLASLILRGWRLNRLIARTGPVSVATRTVVAESAFRLHVASPAVRAGPTTRDALLAGLVRPVLILPQALAGTPDTPAARAVITHELAHLKRGDHRAVWIEEAVVALLAVNPLLPPIRARRAAAREEACDALALAGAEPAARRAYAQSLIEALRARTEPPTLPALTFHGTSRSQAMRRMKSILTPPANAGPGARMAVVAAGLAVLGLAGAGSMAVAAQRPAQMVVRAEAGARPTVAAGEFVRFTADIAYHPAIRIAAGDRLEIVLKRQGAEGGTASTRIDLDLIPGAVPAKAFADLRPPLLPSDRNGPTFSMTARIVGAQGQLKALSDRDLGRPHAPYLIGPDTIWTKLQMLPIEAASAATIDAAYAMLTAERSAQQAARAAAEAARSASGLRDDTPQAIKASCRAGQACDGFIEGFVIHQSAVPAAERVFCAPTSSGRTGQWSDVKTAIARTSSMPGEDTRSFVTRVLAGVYPCRTDQTTTPGAGFDVRQIANRAAAIASAQADGTGPVADTSRLTIKVTQEARPFVIGSGFSLTVSMTGETQDGARTISSEMPLTRDTSIERLVFLDLDQTAFPQRMPGYAYTLKAEIKDAQGRTVYASDPTSLRLAPRSQGQLARLRPELTLKWTTLTIR